MCFEERNTDNRARSPAARRTRRRTLAVRRNVRSLTVAMARSLLLLAFLAEDELGCVFHALALVGLGRTVAADLRRHVADLLAIDSDDHHLGRLGDRDRDPFWDRIVDLVAQPDLELQVLALQLRAIADAVDLELLLETLGDTLDQVGDERPIGAPHGARTLGIDARI